MTSLATEFPADEIKPIFIDKFQPYDDYDLKRVIKIYFKWVRDCNCLGSEEYPSTWSECEFCFRWQHAKRELCYRKADHYCNVSFLKTSFPDLYKEFCVKVDCCDMKKNVYDGPPIKYSGTKQRNYFRHRKR